jgi:hypothetical protein
LPSRLTRDLFQQAPPSEDTTRAQRSRRLYTRSPAPPSGEQRSDGPFASERTGHVRPPVPGKRLHANHLAFSPIPARVILPAPGLTVMVWTAGATSRLQAQTPNAASWTQMRRSGPDLPRAQARRELANDGSGNGTRRRPLGDPRKTAGCTRSTVRSRLASADRGRPGR